MRQRPQLGPLPLRCRCAQPRPPTQGWDSRSWICQGEASGGWVGRKRQKQREKGQGIFPLPALVGMQRGSPSLVSFCAGCCSDTFAPALPTLCYPPGWCHSEITFLTENNEMNRNCSNCSRGCINQNKSRPAVKPLGPGGSALPEGESSIARCHWKRRSQSHQVSWEKKA